MISQNEWVKSPTIRCSILVPKGAFGKNCCMVGYRYNLTIFNQNMTRSAGEMTDFYTMTQCYPLQKCITETLLKPNVTEH